MLKKSQYTILMALALVALVLALTNIVLFSRNQSAQNEFANRAQYIQQSLQLEPLYQAIIRNLAEIAAKTNDPQVGKLLSTQGITFTVNQGQAGQAQQDAKGRSK